MIAPDRPLRILSLGAGVQSTTIALMIAHGELPPIDAAIFADTQSEPRSVYDHLERLRTPGVLPFPVYVETAGSLRQEVFDACNGTAGAWDRPPFYVKNPDGTQGMIRRQCTEDYKIAVLIAAYRRLAGIAPRGRPKGVRVEQVIGISYDEAIRVRDPWLAWIRNDYPLVDRQLNRGDCLQRLAAFGWTAPRSACTFCPYHSDAHWLAMKTGDPESWADAVQVDQALRSADGPVRGELFVHRTMQPLDTIDFAARVGQPKPKKQLRLYLEPDFNNECGGMCGV